MAHEVTLEVYTLTVRKKFEKNSESLMPLNDLAGTDFLQFAHNFCDEFSVELDINEDQKRSFKILRDSLKLDTSSRILRGQIACGVFGLGSNIVNKKGDLRYQKSVDDIDQKPFYFLMHVPKKSNVGTLMLQRFGGDGFFSNFKYNLQKYFRGKVPDLMLDIETMVTKKLYRTLLEFGEANSIVLRRYNLPKDKTDNIGGLDFSESISHIELKIVAKRVFSQNILKAIREAFDDNRLRILSSKTLDTIGLDENAKQFVFVKTGKGNPRKIDLSDHMKLRPYYDIDDKVKKDGNGHPTFESIDQEAMKLLTEIQDELN